MTNVKEKNQIDQKKILSEFWKTLPPVLVLALPSNVISSHPARPEILRLLREGIVDQLDDGTEERVRHALKAEEIRAHLKKQDIKVSKTSLYFHLGVLEDHGLIMVVAKILEGRHKVAYYGRTARGLIFTDLSRDAGLRVSMPKLIQLLLLKIKRQLLNWPLK